MNEHLEMRDIASAMAAALVGTALGLAISFSLFALYVLS